MGVKDLKHAFDPESVVVIDADEEGEGLGCRIMSNIVKSGFKGRLVVVGGESIPGSEAVSGINDIPEGIDLAIICSKPGKVPELVKGLSLKGVKVALIVSRGFAETVRKVPIDLENELRRIVREHGIRVIGPGSQGIGSPCTGFQAFWPLLKPGPVAVVSRSGAVAATLASWLSVEDVGVSRVITLGNKVDVDEVDALTYLRDDDKTRSIALYIEALRNGRRFIEEASKTTAVKPVAALKPGRTRAGAFAVASRTGVSAGIHRLYIEAFRKSGIIPASTIEELYDISKGLSMLRASAGSSVQVVTTSIGAGVIAADYLELYGLGLAKTSPETKEVIRGLISKKALVSNPLNLPNDVSVNEFKLAMEEVIKDERVDIVIVILSVFTKTLPGITEALINVCRESPKPVIPVIMGGECKELAKLHRYGVPAYPTPERAAAVASALVWYSNYLKMRRLGIID